MEVDLSSGQKLNLMTVGLPDTAVRESNERVKAALRNCGYPLPQQHITINLAPADVKKEGLDGWGRDGRWHRHQSQFFGRQPGNI